MTKKITPARPMGGRAGATIQRAKLRQWVEKRRTRLDEYTLDFRFGYKAALDDLLAELAEQPKRAHKKAGGV